MNDDDGKTLDDLDPDDDDNHQIPSAKDTNGGEPEEDQFEEPVASPSVTGEEDAFSGDAPTGEPPDIDSELEKVGLTSDEEGVKPLGEE